MNAVHALLQRRERLVLLGEVGVGRDNIGLGQFHRVFHPALGRRVPRLAGVHGDAVVPTEGNNLLVADRDAGDMLDGD